MLRLRLPQSRLYVTILWHADNCSTATHKKKSCQEPAISTSRLLGPCAPMTIVCSISAVRDGPLMRFTVRGILPLP